MTAGTGIPGLGGCCAHGVGMLDQCDACSSAREIARLSAEVERLRAALDVSDGIRDFAWEWIACGDDAAGELLNAAVLKHGASDIPARGEVR